MWQFCDDIQTAALESLTRVCRDQIKPETDRFDGLAAMDADLVRELLRKLVPVGIGSGRVSEEFGGMGLDPVTAGLLLEEANYWIPDIMGVAFISESAAIALSALASDRIRARYLEPLLRGEMIACSANTEPQGGSDVRSTSARAKRSESGWVISGTKVWITNGQFADFAIVLARTEETSALDLYLVDRKEHGFTSRPLETLGFISTAELHFDDVEVPYDHQLGTGGRGLAFMVQAFQSARAYVGLTAIGQARSAYDCALAFAREHVAFGAPIASKQLIQSHIADNAVDIDAARLLCYRALELARLGKPCSTEASMAKLFASEAAQRISSRSMQILGGMGLSTEMPIEATFRKLRAMTIVEGTSEIQRLIIGRAMTGMSAF